jgi:hypothetical protein
MRQTKPMRRLRAGERVRLTRDGPLYEIARVTPGAAYPYRVYEPPRPVTFERPDGTSVTVHASRGPVEAGISVHAFVYREGEEET